MLTFLASLLRVIIGFILACLAAGAVQVLFAVTPGELIGAGQEYWSTGGLWVLEAATIVGIFALPFAMMSSLISEWYGIRSYSFHTLVAIAISVGGYMLISSGESADVPSVVNSYAMAAFLTAGLIAGTVYWLFAGRFAYRPATSGSSVESDKSTESDTSTTQTSKTEVSRSEVTQTEDTKTEAATNDAKSDDTGKMSATSVPPSTTSGGARVYDA